MWQPSCYLTGTNGKNGMDKPEARKVKAFKLLLGNSERRVSNLIEALVRSACADQAIVECTRAAEIGDFTRQGCEEQLDLIIIVPDKVRPDLSPHGSLGPLGESLRALGTIRRKFATPIIALCGRDGSQSALMEAGADHVLELPFNCEELKRLVRRTLHFQPPCERSAPSRWAFAEGIIRGFQRLTQA
jgi:hypothetical protein